MAYDLTTLSTLKSRLSSLVGGKGNFWSTFELEFAINEALSLWQLLVGEYYDNANLLYPANNAEFVDLYNPSTGAMSIVYGSDTPATLPLSIVRMGYKAAYTTQGLATYPEISQVSVPELDASNPEWKNDADATLEYWAPYGLNKIVFPPHNPMNLAVWYYRGNKPMSADTDYIQLGNEELQAILAYAVWQLNVKCGTEEAFGTTNPLKELLVVAATLRNQKLRGLQLYKDYLGVDKGELEPSRDATPQLGAR